MNQPDELAEERDDRDIVELCEAYDPAEAAAIQATLEDAGIDAEVVGDKAGGAFDLPMNISALQVWVHAHDVERAQTVLAETRQRYEEE